jgi:hypothetical protein
MTGRSDTERFLDAFLAPEADELSDRVLEAALSDIARTPQRRALRVPWRFRNMPVMYRAAAAALALVVLAGAGGFIYLNSVAPLVGGPNATASPRPSAAPSASPGFSRFDSTIHRFSIDYPSGWRARPATEPWTGGPLDFDSLQADVIFDPVLGETVYLLLASQPYNGPTPGDLPAIDWPEDRTWLCAGGGPFGTYRFDGARASAKRCQAPSLPTGSGENNMAFIYTDTRGYLARVLVSSDDPVLIDTYDWDWLKPLLDTIDLRPEEAVGSPRASGSP